MSFLTKSRCHTSSPLLFSTRYHHSIRTYASAPQPRPYSPPNSTNNTPTTQPSVSTKTSPVPLQSVLPTQPLSSRINAPPSTHPPPLTLPTRTPNLPSYKYYFSLGKAYATFYKTGLKSLYTNYRSACALPNGIWSKNPAETRAAVNKGSLSRASFQLLRRTKSDLWKLPPFALVFAICGEFTPLVIVFVTGLVPRIIWIPKQVEGAREKAEKRRRECQRTSGCKATAGEMILRDDLSRSTGEDQKRILKYIAQSLNLYSPVLDKYIPYLIPSSLIRRRVKTKLEDLRVDDFAIARDGGVRGMNKEEVVLACEERGMDILGKEEGELRQTLSRWVEERSRLLKEVTGDEG